MERLRHDACRGACTRTRREVRGAGTWERLTLREGPDVSEQIKTAFQGELMLAGWKESHTSGATVTFWLPDAEDLSVFRGMTARKGNVAGQRFMAVLVEVHDDEALPTEPVKTTALKPPANALAGELHRIRYWHNPKLWSAMEARALYTQAEHKCWIETQPCWGLQGKAAHGPVGVTCQGDVCAHHCNSAALPAAGKATSNPRKPPHWYTLPLCHAHHAWVHSSTGASRVDKQCLLECAVELTATRIKSVMKLYMGIESMSQITLETLHSFETDLRLPRYVQK